MGGNKTKVKGPREEESNTSIAISNSRATCWLALASHAMESCGLGRKQKKKSPKRAETTSHRHTHTQKKERIKEKKRESKKRKEEKKRERPMKRYIVWQG